MGWLCSKILRDYFPDSRSDFWSFSVFFMCDYFYNHTRFRPKRFMSCDYGNNDTKFRVVIWHNSHDQWPSPHWLLVLYMDRSCVRSQYAEKSKMNLKFKSYIRVSNTEITGHPAQTDNPELSVRESQKAPRL